MTALVANYGSDSSESDDLDETSVINDKESGKIINFFESKDQDSDDNERDDCNNQDVIISKGDNQERLPNPLLDPLPSASSTLDTQPGASVFVSQYHLAEKEKQSVLEQHVKLSATKILKTGKKLQICHKFKMGKCKFGKNCKYSHEIDSCLKQGNSNVPLDQWTDPRTGVNSIPLFNDRQKKSFPQPHFIPPPQREDNDDDSYMGSMKRKKRAGLAGTLVPTKKALSSLNRERAVERPWTVTNK